MSKESTKHDIVAYLEKTGWKYGGQIEDDIRARTGAKASTIARRCRELVDEGVIQVEYEQINGKGPYVTKYRVLKVDKETGNYQLAF